MGLGASSESGELMVVNDKTVASLHEGGGGTFHFYFYSSHVHFHVQVIFLPASLGVVWSRSWGQRRWPGWWRAPSGLQLDMRRNPPDSETMLCWFCIAVISKLELSDNGEESE